MPLLYVAVPITEGTAVRGVVRMAMPLTEVSEQLATVRRVAERAAALERLGRAPLDAELHRGLRSVPGLGPWTVAEIVQCTHGDPDSVSVFDFHLADTVCWFFDRRPGDDRRMLELLEPWRGDRQRVVRLLRASGFRKPSFAPRLHPEDHRHR